jgi:hypothetical protein
MKSCGAFFFATSHVADPHLFGPEFYLHREFGPNRVRTKVSNRSDLALIRLKTEGQKRKKSSRSGNSRATGRLQTSKKRSILEPGIEERHGDERSSCHECVRRAYADRASILPLDSIARIISNNSDHSIGFTMW